MVEKYPELFLKRVEDQLGPEFSLYCSSLEQPWHRGIRLNPLKRSSVPWEDLLSGIPWAEEAWYLSHESEIGAHPIHEAGGCYLQEPSAMLPASVLSARPGETVLDLCAAPGGKTTQIAAGMSGKGLLVTNEPVPKRAQILSRNVERMGITNALVVSAYPRQLAESWPELFDAVLVDAPCSGEGMFRRHPETMAEWTPAMASGCAFRQAEILEQAALLVKPGGRLVYSTCTFDPEENERNIIRFLDRHCDFSLKPFFLPEINGENGMFCIWPHRMKGEGQFTALLFREGTHEGTAPNLSLPKAPGKEQMKVLKEFCKAWEGPVGLFGETLIQSGPLPDLRGIRVLRAGIHLGTVKGKIFQPDHAWALSADRAPFPEVNLSETDARKYLHGETLPADGSGWVLAEYGGLCLGWGKVSDGMMKNHYPKGLRKSE